MAIKIENKSTIKLPRKTEETIQSVFDVIPQEHTRGLSKVVLVDRVVPDPRIQMPANVSELPGIYHPKMGNAQPFCEIGIGTLLAGDGRFKRLTARLTFRPNLAYLALSLQAQHYHLTLSHGIKKHQYEGAIRSYIERYHKVWREKQAGWRAKLFKPIQPLIDKWARKWAKAERKRKSA
jgi:hypothetical protein